MATYYVIVLPKRPRCQFSHQHKTHNPSGSESASSGLRDPEKSRLSFASTERIRPERFGAPRKEPLEGLLESSLKSWDEGPLYAPCFRRPLGGNAADAPRSTSPPGSRSLTSAHSMLRLAWQRSSSLLSRNVVCNCWWILVVGNNVISLRTQHEDQSMDEVLQIVWTGCGAAQGSLAQRWSVMTSDCFAVLVMGSNDGVLRARSISSPSFLWA